MHSVPLLRWHMDNAIQDGCRLHGTLTICRYVLYKFRYMYIDVYLTVRICARGFDLVSARYRAAERIANRLLRSCTERVLRVSVCLTTCCPPNSINRKRAWAQGQINARIIIGRIDGTFSMKIHTALTHTLNHKHLRGAS